MIDPKILLRKFASDKKLRNKSKKNYNSMVNNCIQGHKHFCLGAISKINKLYYKK